MEFDALVVIDMQTALVGKHPCNEEAVVRNIAALIDACRASGAAIVYVRHDGGEGDELERGTRGWQIDARLAPQEGEGVFDKHFNSAFRRTGLRDHLERHGLRRLIMCGMQTEFCFDVSVKVAFELGFDVTVPRGTVTTFDSPFAKGQLLTTYFEDCIWNNRYARVLPVSEVLEGVRA